MDSRAFETLNYPIQLMLNENKKELVAAARAELNGFAAAGSRSEHTLKLFFVYHQMTPLADLQSAALLSVREVLLQRPGIKEVNSPDLADAILIQEEETTYKGVRYIEELLNDQILGAFLHKVFTINTDDSATGLLKGLYAGMPRYRYNHQLYRAVPYFLYRNEHVFENHVHADPVYLGAWCGNTKSNQIRKALVAKLKGNAHFNIRTSQSWLDHQQEEKRLYVEILKSGKFSLCPAGWAPASVRIYESMALGRCPVIIAKDFTAPEGPEWHQFALFFSEKKLHKLTRFLKENENQYEKLGQKAKENWDKYFAGDLLKHYYANAFLSLIRSTPRLTRDEELKRWTSFATYWNNKWTIPQRFMNRLVHAFT